MLDNIQRNNTELNITTCSGGIYKTYVKSWFSRFHLTSAYAEEVFKKDSDTIVI